MKQKRFPIKRAAMLFAASMLATSAFAANVVIYEHINKGGKALSTGSSILDMTLRGFNDKASSITVPNGRYVVLYEHVNFRGKSLPLGPGTYNLTNYKGWNDILSSIAVY